MEAIVERCAGLDVHQATVVACLSIGAGTAKPTKQVRTFGTMLADLEELRNWLKANDCSLVAMESTGVYWKPVYAVLENSFELIVGNAQHIRNVPGRKTDVKDCEWISELARHGLIARSLAGVASDVFGVSGWAMLKALIEGEQSPAEMAQLARGRMRRKLQQLERALTGRMEEHHRFVLGVQMRRIETIEADVAELDKRLREKLKPYQPQMRLLVQIPGVDWVIAATIIAEIGVDMNVFVNAAHLASWASICPGSYESAGKRRGGKTRKGNIHLKTALVMAANGASKTRGTYLADKYHRLKGRCGALRAAVAIGHKILVTAYHMLATAGDYKDLGGGYLDQLNTHRTAGNLVRRLRQLGFDVQLTAKAA
jgi:transposase